MFKVSSRASIRTPISPLYGGALLGNFLPYMSQSCTRPCCLLTRSRGRSAGHRHSEGAYRQPMSCFLLPGHRQQWPFHTQGAAEQQVWGLPWFFLKQTPCPDAWLVRLSVSTLSSSIYTPHRGKGRLPDSCTHSELLSKVKHKERGFAVKTQKYLFLTR